MIANSSVATASGFQFINSCKRLTGILKATIFKTTVSQYRGIFIDTACENLSFEYENDRSQPDVILSFTSIIMNASKKANLLSSVEYNEFLTSGLTLTNAITAYDSVNFEFSTSMLSSYTVTGNEIYGTTNWANTPRLGTKGSTSVTQGRTYLVKFKVKPTVNNYFLRMTAMYNESPYDKVKELDGYYNSSSYSDVYFVFTADRNSSKLMVYMNDKVGTNNATQNPFYIKDVAIVDITDFLSSKYMVKTAEKVMGKSYFVGSRTFV
jgi:hypothetical protein